MPWRIGPGSNPIAVTQWRMLQVHDGAQLEGGRPNPDHHRRDDDEFSR